MHSYYTAHREDANQPAVHRGPISDYKIEGPITIDSERAAAATGNEREGKERKGMRERLTPAAKLLLAFNPGDEKGGAGKWRIQAESATSPVAVINFVRTDCYRSI